LTISEESSDKQNSLSTNLTRRWESKFLLSGIKGTGEHTTLMATKPATQVKVVACMDIEVTGIEQGMVVMLNHEILIEIIDIRYDGRGVPPIDIKLTGIRKKI
jgi:hypothetical protein